MHDEGLIHNHDWAVQRPGDRVLHLCASLGRDAPRVADPARITTPSSARHDDVHYHG